MNYTVIALFGINQKQKAIIKNTEYHLKKRHLFLSWTSRRTFIDDEHSDGEERLIVIGLSQALRVLTVVHCWRDDDATIRIISARKATQLEHKLWGR